MWPVEPARPGHARRPSVRRANRGWLLSCRLSLRTPAPTPIAFFRAPYERLCAKEGLRQSVDAECAVHKTCAVARARRAKPGADAPPSASEAKRAEGGLRGGGGRVDINKTNPRRQPNPPSHRSNPRARRAKPGANAPPKASGRVDIDQTSRHQSRSLPRTHK